MNFKIQAIALSSILLLTNTQASIITDLKISGDTALFKLSKIKEHEAGQDHELYLDINL